jgi:hypothetical protein
MLELEGEIVVVLAIVIDNGEVAVLPALSFTSTTKLAVPAVVGEPVMTPVDPARLSPAGNAPLYTLQV